MRIPVEIDRRGFLPRFLPKFFKYDTVKQSNVTVSCCFNNYKLTHMRDNIQFSHNDSEREVKMYILILNDTLLNSIKYIQPHSKYRTLLSNIFHGSYKLTCEDKPLYPAIGKLENLLITYHPICDNVAEDTVYDEVEGLELRQAIKTFKLQREDTNKSKLNTTATTEKILVTSAAYFNGKLGESASTLVNK